MKPSGEDADPAGADQQAHDDQDDPPDHLPADDRDDASDHQDDGEDPQQRDHELPPLPGCRNGTTWTVGSDSAVRDRKLTTPYRESSGAGLPAPEVRLHGRTLRAES